MNNVRAEITKQIYRHIIDQIPFPLEEDEFHDALPILKDGLGLDSIAAVELFFKLEDVFGIHFAAEFFENTPLTVGKLVDHIMDNSNSGYI